MSDDPNWYAFDPREWLDFENVTLSFDDVEEAARELDYLDHTDWDIDFIVERENALQVMTICLICGNSIASCVC